MPRYGDGSAVGYNQVLGGKSEHRPRNYVLPGAAVLGGGYGIASAVRPPAQRMQRSATTSLRNADGALIEAGRKERLVVNNRQVSRKEKWQRDAAVKRRMRADAAKAKNARANAEQQVRVAAARASATEHVVPKMTSAKFRLRRAGIGGAVLASGVAGGAYMWNREKRNA